MMPSSRECRPVDARSGIIVDRRSLCVLRDFSEFRLAELNARSHTNSISILRDFSFMVGFVKLDCRDLALPRRIFAGNCEEETAAAASGAGLRCHVYFFLLSFLPGNGRRGCRRSKKISSGWERSEMINREVMSEKVENNTRTRKANVKVSLGRQKWRFVLGSSDAITREMADGNNITSRLGIALIRDHGRYVNSSF
jgi:hypothetical protein